MGLRDQLRLGTLLTRLAGSQAHEKSDPRLIARRDQVGPGGLRFDQYEPRGPSQSLLIALHGASTNGNQDQRLQHFGRCLALSGARCVLPHVPHLADLRWDVADLTVLEDLVIQLTEADPRPVGLIGFSYGASYALQVAARPSVAHRIGFVLGFGACHSFLDLFDHYLASRAGRPRTDAAWDDWIYLHLVLARRQAAPLALPDPLRREIDSLLRRYCHQATADEKRAFYHRHLEPLDVIAVDHAHRDPAQLDALSPAGKLAGLRCSVGLIHDPDDTLVPAVHSRRLHDELCAQPEGRRHRLLVTSLLKHVTLSGVLNLADLVRLFSILGPMVQSAAERV